MELIPTQIGPYRIEEEIARGQTVVVFRAFDTLYERPAALKVFPPYRSDEIEQIRTFISEGRAATRLRHPNIIETYDAGLTDGYHYVAQELAVGSLASVLAEQEGDLPVEPSIELLEQIGAALDYAHKQDVTHGNLLPANILLSADGSPLLTNFDFEGRRGPALLSDLSPAAVEHLSYLPPEQAKGNLAADSRGDIYALGVLAYRLLTGALPYQGENVLALLYAINHSTPPNPSALQSELPPEMDPAAMDKVVLQALERVPSHRWKSASTFVAALGKSSRGEAVAVPLHVGGMADAEPATSAGRLSTIFEEEAAAAAAELSIDDIPTETRLQAVVKSGMTQPSKLIPLVGARIIPRSARQTKSESERRPIGWVGVAMGLAAAVLLLLAGAALMRGSTWRSIVTDDQDKPVEGAQEIVVPAPDGERNVENVDDAVGDKTEESETEKDDTSDTNLSQSQGKGEIAAEGLNTESVADAELAAEPSNAESAAAAETISESGQTEPDNGQKVTVEDDTVENNGIDQDGLDSDGSPPVAALVALNTSTPLPIAPLPAKRSVAKASPTRTPTKEPTNSPTLIPTSIPTATSVPTATQLPSATPLPTATSTSTLIPTETSLPPLPTPVPPTAIPPTVTSEPPGQVVFASTEGGASAPPVTAPNTIAREPFAVTELYGRLAYALWNPRSLAMDTYVYVIGSGVMPQPLLNKRQPDFRADGWLAFNGQGGGLDNIVRTRSEGQNGVVISTHPEDSRPHWSPTGTQFVFDSTFMGDRRHRIYLSNDVNEEEEEVAQELKPIMYDFWEIFGRFPIFLGDGQIAYQGCNVWENGGSCGIYRIQGVGSKPQQVTYWPSDIPTDNLGNDILFMSNREENPNGDNWEIYRARSDGTGLVRLTNDPGHDGLATASPDGRHIAFVSDRGGSWAVYVMDKDGGGQQKLFELNGEFGPGAQYWQYDWKQERLSWGN